MRALPPLVSWVEPWRAPVPPLEALARLCDRTRPFLRYAAAGPRDLGQWSFAGADPVARLDRSADADGRIRDPWRALARRWPRRVLRRGRRLPFAGGWFGTFGYELRSTLEALPPPRPPPMGFPALALARYDAVVAWDHATGRAYVAGTGATVTAARAAAARLVARLAQPPPPPARRPAARPRARRRHALRPCVDPARYRRQVRALMERIRNGDLFQANLSQRFEGRLDGAPLALFERLAARSPAPFLTYLDVGEGRVVLSTSPERFVALAGDRAETRPMKGTRPRGRGPAEDRRLRRALAASAKDRAELAMIVDLARNDLGRTCRPGTVRVRVARRLEPYATVHQAVAIVEGRLVAGATGVDLVRGAFPPGSVTGAPKVEAMQAIDALEREGRGPYCGAIGWLDDGGDLDLAVAIRTVLVAGDRVAYRVGGGITLRSEPERERAETLTKGRAMAAAVAGGRR